MTTTPKPKAAKKKPKARKSRPKASGARGRSRVAAAKLAAIVELVSNSATIAQACRQCGVSKGTVYDWLKRGEVDLAEGRASTPDVAFLVAMETARATANSSLRKVIHDQAVKRGDWRAAECLLKANDPEWNAGQLKIDHSSSDGSMTPKEVPPAEITVQLIMSEEFDPEDSPFKEA